MFCQWAQREREYTYIGELSLVRVKDDIWWSRVSSFSEGIRWADWSLDYYNIKRRIGHQRAIFRTLKLQHVSDTRPDTLSNSHGSCGVLLLVVRASSSMPNWLFFSALPIVEHWQTRDTLFVQRQTFLLLDFYRPTLRIINCFIYFSIDALSTDYYLCLPAEHIV